jgi:hypothetical protein
MVPTSHFTVRRRSPACIAPTAYTIVKLDDSNTTVMTVEKTMLGENANGVGQKGDDIRMNA